MLKKIIVILSIWYANKRENANASVSIGNS